MGTRGLVHVRTSDHQTLCTIYVHWDANPEGLGQDIMSFLKGKHLTRGISGDGKGTFNGIECLAAMLVGHLKGDKIGNVYLYAPDSKDVGEAYVYTIEPATDETGKERVHITVLKTWGEEIIYEGPADEYVPKDPA